MAALALASASRSVVAAETVVGPYPTPRPRSPFDLGDRFDMNAALRAGPVELCPGEYLLAEPIRIRAGDSIRGYGVHTRLLYDFPVPGIAPENPAQPTDRVTLRDFDLICTATGDQNQHALYMPSCRRWRIDGVRTDSFGGDGILMYGQRTRSGARAPSDATLNMVIDYQAWNCRRGIIMTGTPGEPRSQGGTCNMNTFVRPIVYNCRGDAMDVLQGAANIVDQLISGQNAGRSIVLGWYNNYFRLPVLERNGGTVVYFLNFAEQHGNRIELPHNGGANDAGFTNNPRALSLAMQG